MIRQFILLAGISVLIPLYSINTCGQQRTMMKSAPKKIIASRPGVSMSFIRFEQIRSNEKGLRHRLAWIRIDNNMTFPIRFCSYDGSVSPNGKVGATFELEKIPNLTEPSSRDNSSLPLGMIGYDMCTERTIKSGKSFEFALSIDSYRRDTRIKFQFFYDWEDAFETRTGNEPSHFVYFFLRDIPDQ